MINIYLESYADEDNILKLFYQFDCFQCMNIFFTFIKIKHNCLVFQLLIKAIEKG